MASYLALVSLQSASRLPLSSTPTFGVTMAFGSSTMISCCMRRLVLSLCKTAVLPPVCRYGLPRSTRPVTGVLAREQTTTIGATLPDQNTTHCVFFRAVCSVCYIQFEAKREKKRAKNNTRTAVALFLASLTLQHE